MDGSQITGASSSYSRKIALSGLFLIDDSKDSDLTNDGTEAPKKVLNKQKPTSSSLIKLTDDQIQVLINQNKEEKAIEQNQKRYDLTDQQISVLKNSLESKNK